MSMESRIEMWNYTRETWVSDMEANSDHEAIWSWLRRNYLYSIHAGVLYALGIFALQRYMRDKAPMQFRTTLVLWNLFLAVFSGLGAWRANPEMWFMIKRYGFHSTVCDSTFIRTPLGSFWGLMFVLSKVPELGDTIFLVLKKRKVIFLHWYHHAIVVFFAAYCVKEEMSSCRWQGLMNFNVHAVMYLYFGVMAWGYRIPKRIAMIITTAQLLQMFMGMFVNFWALGTLVAGRPCGVTYTNVSVALAIYLTFVILFAQFFIRAYGLKVRSVKVKVEEDHPAAVKDKLHEKKSSVQIADFCVAQRVFDRI